VGLNYLYGGYITYVTLKCIAPVIKNQWGKVYKVLKFSAYYETTKFTGDQSDLLGKLE